MSKALIGAALVGGALAFGAVTNVSAANDYVPFNFVIKPNSAASYTSARYRQTADKNNNWKVGVGESEEGYQTYYSFRLQANGLLGWGDASRVVTAGPYLGYAYSPSNGGAEKTDARLKGANPTKTTSGYHISGWWDEETGVISSTDSRRNQ